MVKKSGNDGFVEEELLTFSPSQSRRLLGFYYEDSRLPSPAGGVFQVLRVKSEDNGSGVLILECGSSSLRYVLKVPKAKRAEKRDIQAEAKKGGELWCPRHSLQPLNRVADKYVCRKCGVTYATSK